MTTVKYLITENNIELEIQGHAGFDEVGKDIVCAAISILSQTFIGCMEEESEYCDYRIDPGYVWIQASGYKVVDCFKPILVGYQLLEDNYPAYIEVIEV